MRNYNYSADPFSINFNLMKIRYADYDDELTRSEFLNANDKINVFINLETAFKNLSMTPDIETKLLLHKKYPIILTSNIINLAAHYKRFFVSNGLDTHVYIYNTDLDSDKFNQRKYNPDYRSYYLIKYNQNPKFAALTEGLKTKILPEVKTLCDFIPGVYYISAQNIAGSLVPYIVAKSDESRKNLVISGDVLDSQMTFLDNFFATYLYRSVGIRKACSNITEFLQVFTKKDENYCKELGNTYGYHGTYCSLMSVLGNRIRSIDGINGYGIQTLKRSINDGVSSNKIQITTDNPEMLSNIFNNEDDQLDFKANYYCSSIPDMYNELTESEILSVLNQREDRFDEQTLMRLNSTTFYNYPLILEALL